MKKKRLFPKKTPRVSFVLPLLLSLALLLYFVKGSSGISSSVDAKQLDQLSRTIRRYTVQCYALEGRYPQSLEYLEQRYGLTLDRERYVFHYRNLGANMLPEIAVFELGPVQ